MPARAPLGLLVVLVPALAGCSGGDGEDEDLLDALPSDPACELPGTEPGSSSYLVGTVSDASGDVVPGATVRATGGTEPRTDTTNDSGCYFLDLEPGATYSVQATAGSTASLPRSVTLEPGDKDVLNLRVA